MIEDQATLRCTHTTSGLSAFGNIQTWNLQKSGVDDGVKIEFRFVLATFMANLSFPVPRMLLSGL